MGAVAIWGGQGKSKGSSQASGMWMRGERKTLVADWEDRVGRRSDWVRQFIDSLSRQLAAGRALTQKQSDTLDDVWERVTAKG